MKIENKIKLNSIVFKLDILVKYHCGDYKRT